MRWALSWRRPARRGAAVAAMGGSDVSLPRCARLGPVGGWDAFAARPDAAVPCPAVPRPAVPRPALPFRQLLRPQAMSPSSFCIPCCAPLFHTHTVCWFLVCCMRVPAIALLPHPPTHPNPSVPSRLAATSARRRHHRQGSGRTGTWWLSRRGHPGSLTAHCAWRCRWCLAWPVRS